MRKFIVTVVASLFSLAAHAAEIVEKRSPHTVVATMDKLEAAVGNAGATVFARIDHAGGAEKIGESLLPTQVLIFGNPKIGTPLMQANGAAGLDLPMRVVVYAHADGGTRVAYRDPIELANTHGVSAELPVFSRMADALNKLTDAAVAD